MRKTSSFAKANFQKGFTLIEVLLITVLLAILGLAALSAFTDSSGTFNFLENYKNITASLRSTRVFAITNKIEGAERYGVYIKQTANGVTNENIIQVTSFADNGVKSFEFEADKDEVMPADTYTITGNYDLSLQNAAAGNGLPLSIFYHAGGEKMTVISNGDILPSADDPLIVLKFTDNAGHEKYVGIFQVSGLIEEFNVSPLFKSDKVE